MKWALILTNPARRALRDVPRADIDQIDAVFEQMRANPYSDIRILKGADRALRRRIGSWRILFEVHADREIVIILAVERRSSTTY
jgi:mRNA-degrading endonuclease RelE of RelBE toxin-antitoxin system